MASTARLDELKKKFDENPRRYFAPLANEHRKSGDLDQAIALCRTHLPQQPAHISGHIVLAQALFEAGSLDESREIFHTALGLDPENLIALRYLGDIAREAADVSTARSWYQRVLEVDPRNDEIVQLVRELDAPRPVAADEVPAAPVSEAAPATPVAPAPTPVAEDPRFAPLSLEHVDFDGPAPSAPSYAANASAAPDALPDESFDVHGARSAETPDAELPMLDASELDPFDLHPSASAESLLFDANAAAPQEDVFMTELADLGSPEDAGQIEAEYSVGDAWAPTPEAEPAATSPADDVVAAATGTPESTSFEEGAFYTEPTAEAPGDTAASDQAMIDASTAETALWELPEPPQASATTEVEDAAAAEPEHATASAFDVFDAVEPNAAVAVPETFADAPTAEWQTAVPAHDASPADAIEEALGLEVMEFVPPSSEAAAAPAADHTSAVDDRGQDSTTAGQNTAPAAFMTETMAELYLQQGFRNEALAVYRELLSRNPDDASLRDRIDQIERGSLSSIGSAAVSEDVVESALRRQSARPARSVRSFFASLAGRRAPYQPQPNSDALAADVSAFAPTEPEFDDVSTQAETGSVPEASGATAADAGAEAPAESARITPLVSAAETLASYDPFADAPDASMALGADDSDALAATALPNVELPVLPVSAPAAPKSLVEGAPARRTLEDLFPDAPIAPRAEAAAETLATAFGRSEPQGRPTRAASSELSLDKVFRGSPEGAPPADGGFSFDQFFSDARPGGDVAAPTMSPPETGRSGGPGGDAHDIEQFTAWLEGLKKK